MKPNKQVVIDFIISKLKTGMDTEKICVLTCTKFDFTRTTFYNRFKIAQFEHTKAQEAIRIALMKEDTKNALDTLKLDIMEVNERKELLTKIANGELKIKKPFVIAGKIMEYPSEPDHTDRRNAIAELNKMDGAYAPAKVAQTDSKGNDIKLSIDL